MTAARSPMNCGRMPAESSSSCPPRASSARRSSGPAREKWSGADSTYGTSRSSTSAAEWWNWSGERPAPHARGTYRWTYSRAVTGSEVQEQPRPFVLGGLGLDNKRELAAGAGPLLSKQLKRRLDAGATTGTAETNRGRFAGLLRRGMLVGPRPPEQIVDSCQQALECKGLADVVDRSDLSGVGLVLLALMSGDHDEWRGARFTLKVLQHREAAPARHHHVENDQIRSSPINEFARLKAVLCLKSLVAVLLQHRL